MKSQSKLNLERGLRLTAALWIAALGFVFNLSAQPTNAPAPNDFSNFQIIAERNIFNPNRTGRSRYQGPRAPEVRVDSFSLVGTMSYEKGMFAFFAGSSSEYQKALSLEDTIAGFKVIGIESEVVTLEREGKQTELRLGAQMRREDRGEWRAAAAPAFSERQPERSEGVAAAGSSEPPDVGSSEMNAVLRAMMERRAKEEN